MPLPLRRDAATLALPLVLGACVDAAEPRETVVRDSAGITIIENPSSETVPALTVGEPRIALGGMDQGEAYELYRPMSALRLDDGRIVVANQGTHELRFYAPGGDHLRTVGRFGAGPGEFQGMWSVVRLPGDSLGVWDYVARRFTLYDDQGTFARVITPGGELSGFAPRLMGTLDDGSLIVLKGFEPTSLLGAGGGIQKDSILLIRYAPHGALIDSLPAFPGAQRYVHAGQSGFWMRQVRFGREEHVAVGANVIFVGDDRTGEIRALSPDGRLLRLIRLHHDPRPVRDSDLARHEEETLADVAEDNVAELRTRLDETPVAETLPAFETLFADRLGRLWIEDFDGYYDRPDAWTVLDPEGRLLARLDLPSDVMPLDAGEDYLLTYHRDDLDIEHVQLLPIITTTETP